LSSQVSDLRGIELEAWINFLRAHAAVTRQFNAELLAMHGLTINDYDVLAQLSRAPEQALKRVELAERVLLTPSGITRLLKGLETAGYVSNRPCAEDARVTSVRALFSERFEKDELETLASLLERLPLRDTACD
jgi:DNA-binding MarR family transcriptional regulator